jgi:hypothetical protein
MGKWALDCRAPGVFLDSGLVASAACGVLWIAARDYRRYRAGTWL